MFHLCVDGSINNITEPRKDACRQQRGKIKKNYTSRAERPGPMGRMWDVMWKQLPAVGWWTVLEPPTPPATGKKKLFCTEWPIA
jgi:hypothetical protein